MEIETLKTVAAIAGPTIATASLFWNYRQYVANRTQVPLVARKEDVRSSIASIIQKVDSSEIFTIPPNYELWQYGFESLEEARNIFATASTLISSSNVPPHDIKLIVSDLLHKTRSTLKYRDSLRQLMGNSDFITYSAMEGWSQKQHAEVALYDLQAYIRSRDSRLREYLASLSN